MSSPELPEPGEELETFLHRVMPAGALLWRLTGVPAMQWICPPGQKAHYRPREPLDSELRLALSGIGVRHKVAQGWILAGPMTEIMVNSPAEQDRNHGYAARTIQVAGEYDIAGHDLSELGSFLDLSDHVVPQNFSAKPTAGDPRGARRYLKRGREVLSALGVWPWFYVDDWRHTRRWWKDVSISRAFFAWLDREWMEAARRLAFNARVRHGQNNVRGISVAEHQECLEFRAALRAIPEFTGEPT